MQRQITSPYKLLIFVIRFWWTPVELPTVTFHKLPWLLTPGMKVFLSAEYEEGQHLAMYRLCMLVPLLAVPAMLPIIQYAALSNFVIPLPYSLYVMITFPGTSSKTNPNAMKTIFRNTLFTNVASTSDGGVFWEGMEDELAPGVTVTDWLGRPWNGTMPAAHPNSRYSTWQNIINDNPEDEGWDVTPCRWANNSGWSSARRMAAQDQQHAWPWRWRHYDTSKHWKLHTWWHGVTYQEIYNFIHTLQSAEPLIPLTLTPAITCYTTQS